MDLWGNVDIPRLFNQNDNFWLHNREGIDEKQREPEPDSQEPQPNSSSKSNSKYWCFTSYKADAPVYSSEVSYGVCQQEVCPTTGREHWQGYVEFTQKKRLHLVQAAIGDARAHCELRKGTRGQAIAYCKKSESRKPGTEPREHGECPAGEESKSQMAQITGRIEQGGKYADICAEYPSAIIRYDKGIRALIANKESLQPMSYRALRVLVLTGPPGCGKTRWAYDYITKFYAGLAYNKTYTAGQTSWWDGYNNQQVILIDDFEGEAPIEELLQLLGGYGHCRGWQVKGGFCHFNNLETVIFTSNSLSTEWYWGRRNMPQSKMDALKRRLTEEINYVDNSTFIFNRDQK